MATTYNYISANKRRSVVLIAGFIVLVVLLGWVISRLFDYGTSGVLMAVLIALVMALGGYFYGDSMALSVAGAKGPIAEKDVPELCHLVENLCLSSGTAVPKIYLLPEENINAFATGRDPAHASIAVTVGAVQKLERAELEGVIAHELSHIRNYDIRFMTLVAVLVGIVGLLSDFFMRSWMWGGNRRRSDNDNNPIQMVFVIVGIVLLIFAPIVAQLIKLAISRKREFLADASGALLTRYPEGLARALEKIGAENKPMERASTATAHMYISSPFSKKSGWSNLFQTHPPIAERVAALRAMDHG